MPGANQRESIYDRFADGCQRRRDKISALLVPTAADPRRGRAEAIKMLFHDWIGEAKILGFDRLAVTATKATEVLALWGADFNLDVQGAQLRAWANRLNELSQKAALSAPARELERELRNLESELDQELAIAEARRSPTNEQPALTSPGRRILVLDDSQIVGEMLAMELENRGHRVAVTSALAEFNNQLARFDPEMIFLDINMPEIQGDEVCRQLRKQFTTRSVPIIFLSSLSDAELAALAARAGADGYLSKQRGIDDLVKYLDELMGEIVF